MAPTTRRALFAAGAALLATPALAAAGPQPSVAATWQRASALRDQLDGDVFAEDVWETVALRQGRMELDVAQGAITSRADAAAKLRLAIQSCDEGWWSGGEDRKALEQVAAWLEAL